MFEHTTELRENIYCYMRHPKMIESMKDLNLTYQRAEQNIQQARELIEKLKEYEILLYERSKDFLDANYHPELFLIRSKAWKGNVTYYVKLQNIFDSDNIKPVDIINEKFPGNERKKAFELFESLKKSRPGIITNIDIEKKRWET